MTESLTPGEQREIIERYLLGKFYREDCDDVADAAMDLRGHDE